MTITATAFGGNQSNAASGNINPGSLASSAGDLIVVFYSFFDNGTAATQAAGTVTSTPAKTFTKPTNAEFERNALGLAVYTWVSDGTTLTQISVAPTAGTSVGGCGGTTIKLASGVGTPVYDSTTKGTGADITSPLAWSAGGAVAGTQVGLTGVIISNNASGAFTPSTGYTNAYNFGNGTLSIVHEYCFKTGETGTPSLSIAYSAAIIDAAELFVSFAEPSLVVPPQQLIVPTGAIRRAARW